MVCLHRARGVEPQSLQEVVQPACHSWRGAIREIVEESTRSRPGLKPGRVL